LVNGPSHRSPPKRQRSARGEPRQLERLEVEASDSRNFETLLGIGPDVDPRAAVADKGYDAKSNRDAARKRGICPVIPYRANTINKPKFFAKLLYKARARIEQMNGKIKRFKRITLRCEKTARNYASFLALVCGFILIKPVHTA
jgi:transposase